LSETLLGFLHPPHVSRAADKQQPAEDLLDERPHLGKGEPWPVVRAQPFALHIAIGHRGDDHMVLPARIRTTFEVAEAELGLEVLVMLFDRPPLMRCPVLSVWAAAGSRLVPEAYSVTRPSKPR
jgi:hypothetical protein